jgi:hypothetical protein
LEVPGWLSDVTVVDQPMMLRSGWLRNLVLLPQIPDLAWPSFLWLFFVTNNLISEICQTSFEKQQADEGFCLIFMSHIGFV